MTDPVPVTPAEMVLAKAEEDTSMALAMYWQACFNLRVSRGEDPDLAARLSIRDTFRLCGFQTLSNIASQSLFRGLPLMKEPIVEIFKRMSADVTEHLEGMMPEILAGVEAGHAKAQAEHLGKHPAEP